MPANSKFGNLEEQLRPQPVAWRNFEEEVAQYVATRLSNYDLGIMPNQALVFHGKKYHSKDRDGDVTFDVALEVFSSEHNEIPILKWVWECKDYPNHKVSVNEVEVFADQVKQVGAHKGTVVTRLGFQEGAINLAKSRGIGLMVLTKEKQFHIAFSRDAGILSEIQIPATFCLYTFGETIKGPNLDTVIEFELGRAGIPFN